MTSQSADQHGPIARAGEARPYTIRPFNTVSAFLLLVAAFFAVGSAFGIVSLFTSKTGFADNPMKSVVTLFGFAAMCWGAVLILWIVFKPKIVLYEDRMEIHHWEHGRAYGRNSTTMRFPKVLRTKISYGYLSLFGAYTVGDVMSYIEQGSGFLADEWTAGASGSIPITIKMPNSSKMRTVYLFVQASGACLVMDAELFGTTQVQVLQRELQERSGIKCSGRTKVDNRGVRAKPDNKVVPDGTPPQEGRVYRSPLSGMIRSFIILIAALVWVFCVPVSMIWLEGVFNPEHGRTYQNGWRIVFTAGFMIVNLCSLVPAVMRAGAKVTNKGLRRSKTGSRVTAVVFITAYAAILASFIISINS